MFKLTKKKIICTYQEYKDRALSYIQRKQTDTAIVYIEAAAYTAYTFEIGFKDDDLEKLIHQCAKGLKTNKVSYFDKKSCVFYDSYSKDNAGLTQQYVEAILKAGYKLTYITEKHDFLSLQSGTKGLIDKYPNTTIMVIPKDLKGVAKAQWLYDSITMTEASKIFIHSSPRTVCANIAFAALPEGVERFKINLTDHAFWIGATCMDYIFEFANYGCNLSNHYRNVNKNRIMYIPFYPIMERHMFKGFPEESKGRFIIFSGGHFYKICDQEDTYFKLCRAICEVSPKIIILYAGEYNQSVIDEKIKRYNLEGMFFPLGYRQDITECFEHCDAYLNTYPFGGGLMTQYAAQKGKPIVSYYTGENRLVEEYTCQKRKIEISSFTFEEVKRKVEKLLDDDDFYSRQSKDIRSCVITPDEFNSLFKESIEEKKSPLCVNWQNDFNPLPFNFNDKLDFENKNHHFQVILSKIFGKSAIWRCPDALIIGVISVVRRRLSSYFRLRKR